jgi:hypothetical protein
MRASYAVMIAAGSAATARNPARAITWINTNQTAPRNRFYLRRGSFNDNFH